jgi:hypothetical protein
VPGVEQRSDRVAANVAGPARHQQLQACTPMRVDPLVRDDDSGGKLGSGR